MTAREQTGDRELYCLVLAYNDFTNLLRERLNVIGHRGMICGNNAFRKHDVGGNEFRSYFFTDALVAPLYLINQAFLRIFVFVSSYRGFSVRAVGQPWPETSSMPGFW